MNATPTNVATSFTFAIGLPLAGLETGIGLAEPVQSTPIGMTSNLTIEPGQPTVSLDNGIGLAGPAPILQFGPESVSPPVVESWSGASPNGSPSPFGPSASGPSTTLNPLGNVSETAVAAAAEVAQPTPGRSERISSMIMAPPITLLPHYPPPEPAIVEPVPEIQESQPVQPPAEPAQPPPKPSAPAEPARPIDAAPAPAPVPKEAPAEPKESVTFEAWDAAIDLMATDLSEDSLASPTSRAEESMAVGALLAAWGGWNYRSGLEGRSRRRPFSIDAHEAGPRDGAGH